MLSGFKANDVEEGVDTNTGDDITGIVGTVMGTPEAENDGNVYMTDVGGKIPMPECVCVCACACVSAHVCTCLVEILKY